MSDELLDDDFVEDNTLELRAFVAGSRDSVFEHWISPELLREWWWPMFDDTRYETDPVTGGGYQFGTSEGGFTVSGQYTQVDAPKRIEFTWLWSGEDSESTVAVEFAEQEGGTLVTVQHEGLASDELESLEQGWGDVLTRLEERFDELDS